ncbi:hypothetical protein RFI_28412, partial [Reticulomyxa filosa]
FIEKKNFKLGCCHSETFVSSFQFYSKLFMDSVFLFSLQIGLNFFPFFINDINIFLTSTFLPLYIIVNATLTKRQVTDTQCVTYIFMCTSYVVNCDNTIFFFTKCINYYVDMFRVADQSIIIHAPYIAQIQLIFCLTVAKNNSIHEYELCFNVCILKIQSRNAQFLNNILIDEFRNPNPFPGRNTSDKNDKNVIIDPDDVSNSSGYGKLRGNKQRKHVYLNNLEDGSSKEKELIVVEASEEKIENEGEHAIDKKNSPANELAQSQKKWDEYISEQTKVKEYVSNLDTNTPRTLDDMKYWQYKQGVLQELREKQDKKRKESEELRNFDLLKSGHIAVALRPKNDELTKHALPAHKFDFNNDPTYVDEGVKYLRYWYTKYMNPFANSFLAMTTVCGICCFGIVKYNWIDLIAIIEWYNQLSALHSLHSKITLFFVWIHRLRPYNYKNLNLLSAESNLQALVSLWQPTFLPLLLIAGVYMKCHGEIWEYLRLKKELKTNQDKKFNLKPEIDTLMQLCNKKNRQTSQNHTKLLHEIQLIKLRDKERSKSLQPLRQVVDVFATFQPVLRQQQALSSSKPIWSLSTLTSPTKFAYQCHLIKNLIDKRGVSRGLMMYVAGSSGLNPRMNTHTQQYGLLRLQTRLDEFGRVIPGWQRETSYVYVVPYMLAFLFVPQIADWLTSWGTY